MSSTVEPLFVHLLNGFRVRWGERTFDAGQLRLHKARDLIKLLALAKGHRLHREQLMELLWPEDDPEAAAHNLYQTLYALRRALQALGADPQACLVFEEGVLHLCPDMPVWIDVEAFETAAAQAVQSGNAALYQAAVELYAGELLPEDRYEEWAIRRREALQQVYLNLLLGLARLQEGQGEYQPAIETYQRALAVDPLQEEAHAGLMRLYARSGQRQQALRQYQALEEVLQEELQAAPDTPVRQLYQEIIAGSYPQGELGLAVAPAPQSVGHNLRTPAAPLTGREAELGEVLRLLADPGIRLVTLQGPGGSGKSRLALEAAWQCLEDYPDGVYWVELSDQPGPQELFGVIASALGIASLYGGLFERRSLAEQVQDHLREKCLLLVLDGFEGMLAGGKQVSLLLSGSPGLKILVTSRARLSLEGEQAFPLEGLKYPGEGDEDLEIEMYSSVRLFEQAARRLQPSFRLTEQNRLAVSEICRLVQGMPLGVLLAAAWIEVLEPDQIAREIRQGIDILSEGWRDLPERQRSLRACFDHSLRMLREMERRAFLRLSVFCGSFTAGRANEVTGIDLLTLKGLVDQSLVLHAGPGTYRLHDLMRQYAHEALELSPEESRAVRQRHSQAYLGALAKWEPRLKCREQPDALQEMDREYADILAAWEWAVEQEDIAGLEKTEDSLFRYHSLRGRSLELGVICQKAAHRLEDRGIDAANFRLWLRLATMQAQAFFDSYQFDEGCQVIQQIDAQLQKWGELVVDLRREIAMFHLTNGYGILFSGGNRLKALESYQRGLELMYRGEDPWDISFALYCVSMIFGQAGYIREIGRYAEEALAIQKFLGDPFVLAYIYAHLGFYAMLIGDYQAALKAAEEEKFNRQRVGDPINQAIGDEQLGLALFFAGQYEQAGLLLERALPFFDKVSLNHYRNGCQLFLAFVELFTGRYQAVLDDVVYGGEPLSMDVSAQVDLFKAHVHLLRADQVALLSKSWEDPEAVRLYALAAQELVNYLAYLRSLPRLDWIGVSLVLLGYISYRSNRLDEARQYLEDALENGLTQGLFWVFMLALSVLAVILAEAGELEEAAELYATAAAHPCAANSRWWEDMFGRRIAALTNSLPAETLAAAQARGRARRLDEAGQQYLDWLKNIERFPQRSAQS